ncbi:lactonase family protein [Gorillibacterium timonense]|uniref:lactonase family protein n=1 Tax=Gorillibacterium timonense TaxID=1689269 RepID=UPI00071E250E|nr:lactonase family protein [Gorillibacterium timonense]
MGQQHEQQAIVRKDSVLHKEGDSLYGLFFGTYASAQETGVHYAQFDAGSGEIKLAEGIAGIENPSFLHYDKDSSVLYAVSEAMEQQGEVASYAWLREEKRLELLGTQPSGGMFPCHIRKNPLQPCIALANYGAGGVSLYPVELDGRIGPAACRIEEEGSGPRLDRQEGPHPHSANWSSDGRFLYVPDLGTDKIRVYRLDTDEAGTGDASVKPSNAYRLQIVSSVSLKPGSGPRHFVLHPHLPIAYSIQELDSTVARFRIEEGGAQLTTREVLPSLPADYQGRNDSADLHLSRDARFLYASNRGHDSIAVYSAAPEDGRLTLVEIVPTGGSNPRNFALSPDEAYLLSANQGSDSITVFRRDPQTGKLTGPISTVTGIKQPVCIEWE